MAGLTLRGRLAGGDESSPRGIRRSVMDSGANERQQIGVYLVRVRRRHSMRQAGVRLERPLLQEFDGSRTGRGEWTNLVVLPMHHQTGISIAARSS